MTQKILFVASSLYEPGHPNSTGGTISNYLLLQTLAKYSDLFILLLGPKAAQLDDVPGAKVIRAESASWRGRQLIARWNPYVRSATRSVVAEYGPFDAVIASSDTVPCLVPSVINAAASVVLIRAFENFGAWAPGVTLKTRVSLLKQAVVRRFVDSRIVRDATLVATNSHYMCGAIQDHFKCNSDMLNVIVQQCKLEPANGDFPARNKVGFVNRSADKNLDLVLDLAARTPDLEYLVYGHTSNLLNTPTNLTIMGWSNDRQDMFSSARVWLVPSLWPEPFGRVAIEAQAANRAVIVHAIGGLPETVIDTKYALDALDTHTWEHAIRRALQTSEADLSRTGSLIRQMFSAEAHDQSIKNLLAKLPMANC